MIKKNSRCASSSSALAYSSTKTQSAYGKSSATTISSMGESESSSTEVFSLNAKAISAKASSKSTQNNSPCVNTQVDISFP
ncbi:hypothetical protein I1H34_04190 [Acaryochloris marina S15]|nr:hypothetical protein I1H34_04190 [Acaryochloris marina S15]